jgi:hypothetical protein
MQHLVYQILMRGTGDLVETGRSLHAISAWLESLKTVSVADAPLVGVERKGRVIKTHLPEQLCPYRDSAKYIYVSRHPVSCFASCVDYVTSSLGWFAPTLEQCEAWFRSDLMWWGTWPAHVAGWWRASQEKPNLLFINFEDMRADLSSVAEQIGEFLGVERFTQREIEQIVSKSSFSYMAEHADAFDMNPPHLLRRSSSVFVSGKRSRHRDVAPQVHARLSSWCREELAATGFPLEKLYPDVALGPSDALIAPQST